MNAKEQAKKIIIEMVQEKQGCKATEVEMKPEIASLCYKYAQSFLFTDLLEELVCEDKLVRVKYYLDGRRSGSFLLPSKTKMN